MRIFFDQGVPVPLRDSLAWETVTCYEAGWSKLANGELLAKAENEFDVFVTTDKNIRYQQAIQSRKIAIFVLPTTRWPLLRSHTEAINQAIVDMPPCGFTEWKFP